MPCYRCGTRQNDPVRGPSPWKRGVRDGVQVLVCPECQRTHPWADDMDHCPQCGSVSLSRALGETTCKACGANVPSPTTVGRVASEPAPGLSDDVAAALERALRKPDA